MEAEEGAEVLVLRSSVKKKRILSSHLSCDGHLLLYGDPVPWIQSNPTSLLYVRSLELQSFINDGDAIGDSLGKLVELTHLYIETFSWQLKCLPYSITRLQKLEELHVKYCTGLNELPENLGQLENLKHLYVCDCPFINSLPNSITKLHNLVTLDLSECRSLTALPSNLGQLVSLRHLSLLDCPIESLPDSMTKLSSLETLDLTGCCSIKDSVGIFGQLVNLKSLSLCFCCFNSLNMPNLSNLESLHLCGKCDPITELPAHFDQYVSLRHLSLHDCGDFKSLPQSMSKLSNLENLILRGQFRDDPTILPKNFNVLVGLKCLSLNNYAKVESLPHSLTKLSNLETLKLYTYFELKELPPHMDKLVSLRHLSLDGFCGIETFPDILTRLSSLVTLRLYGLSDYSIPLVELPESLDKLVSLRHFSLGYCEIPLLPESITKLSNLETLILQGCDYLRALPVNMGELVSLKHLSLEYCGIETLPSIAGLHNLEVLELKACHSLKELPEDLGELVKLISLNISGVEIKCLPGSVSKLQNLQSLILPEGFRLETLLPLNFKYSVLISVYSQIYEKPWSELREEIMPFSERMVSDSISAESGRRIVEEQISTDGPFNVLDAAPNPEETSDEKLHQIL